MYGWTRCSSRLRSTGLGKTIRPSFLRSIFPSGLEDAAVAPDVEDAGEDVGLFEGLVPERVAGDDLAAMTDEGGGDGTLAGPDPADEAEDGLGVS